MPKKSSKSRSKNKKSPFLRFISYKKGLLVFVLLFAAVASFLIFKGYAAVGDELQAKDNSIWSGAYAKKIVMSPDGSYGFTLDAFGALHPFHTYGSQPNKPSGLPYWKGWDIARDVVVTKWSTSNSQGYILDGFGGIQPFGGAPSVTGAAYFKGWDIARKIVMVKGGGYVLDGIGGLHPFAINGGTMPPNVKQGPYWPGDDRARDVAIRDDGAVGHILDCHGGISPVGFGSHSAPGYVNGFPYNGSKCSDLAKLGADYRSFTDIEWSKPSGTVISSKGQFAGFGTRSVAAYTNPGLGKVVDGTCKYVTAQATTRCWALDEKGNIRAFSEPNKPLFTDKEGAFFAEIKKQEDIKKWNEDVAKNEAEAAKKSTSSNTGGKGGAGTSGVLPPGFSTGIADTFMNGVTGRNTPATWKSPIKDIRRQENIDGSVPSQDFTYCAVIAVGNVNGSSTASVYMWVNRRFHSSLAFGYDGTKTENDNKSGVKNGQTICQTYHYRKPSDTYRLEFNVEIANGSKYHASVISFYRK